MKVIGTMEGNLSENDYKKLLIELDDESLKKLVHQFNEWNSSFQYGLITVIGKKIDVSALAFLEGKLNSDDPEVRIRTLKAINKIGAITNLEMYLSFVDSSIWEERLMVARLFRNISFEKALPYLKKLIQDESWWVRSEAAQTINQSRYGKEALKEIIENSSDPFAIDMAREYFKRGSRP